MMTMIRLSLSRRMKKNAAGFTLIEVLVAILIGLIVMGMSIAILGATNSTALRVLAKSNAQENTRDSISKILDNLADADSLENCRVASNQAEQTALAPPNALGHPDPAIPFPVTDCKETAATGYVLALANPNKLCYFKTVHHDVGTGATTTASSDPATIVCIARGTAALANYETPAPPVSTVTTLHGINMSACLNSPYGTDRNLVYLYTCKANPGTTSSINWPTVYNAPLSTDISVIADLGSALGKAPIKNLFQYTYDGSLDADLVNVIAVDVRMDIAYASGQGTNTANYVFHQTIVLRKSKLALGEDFNG